MFDTNGNHGKEKAAQGLVEMWRKSPGSAAEELQEYEYERLLPPEAQNQHRLDIIAKALELWRMQNLA